MGGKTNLLDPVQLETLYMASRQFEDRAHKSIQGIHKKLMKLHEESLHLDLSNEEGRTMKEGTASINQAVEALMESLGATSQFIDGRLAGAVQYSQKMRRGSSAMKAEQAWIARLKK
ncbi:hypothetical protein ABN764_16105 [Paenibacillaceae sp. P-4]|uniref:hypothetical protein n=1 Tax=Paenibacillaceae bacterium P-4 TaxID=3160969 RepID=UPI0032E809E7